VKKYLKAIQSGFLQQLNEKAQLVGRLLLFTVIVYLFYQIFESVGASEERLWYYAMTEAIVLSSTLLAVQIAQDIRSQQIVYFLLKPIDYPSFRITESMGAALFRFMVLIIWGLGYLSFLKGVGPISLYTVITSFFVGIIGVFLYTQMSFLIGLLSFWIKDIKTLQYLNLTATFCFGGLIIPISYYPPLMQKICFFTPYPWILWWPGTIFSGGEIPFVSAFCCISLWIGFFVGLNRFIFYRYMKNLVMEGG